MAGNPTNRLAVTANKGLNPTLIIPCYYSVTFTYCSFVLIEPYNDVPRLVGQFLRRFSSMKPRIAA